jgi:hypothetical protein
MANIIDVETQLYHIPWIVDYQPANDLAKVLMVGELLQATKNYLCIAKDLFDCDLPQTNVVRSKLQISLRAFYRNALAFYRTYWNAGVASLLLGRINARLAALAVQLVILDENLNTPLPPTIPPQLNVYMLPNAQPLELLVSAILQILPDDANLGKEARMLCISPMNIANSEYRSPEDTA